MSHSATAAAEVDSEIDRVCQRVLSVPVSVVRERFLSMGHDDQTMALNALHAIWLRAVPVAPQNSAPAPDLMAQLSEDSQPRLQRLRVVGGSAMLPAGHR